MGGVGGVVNGWRKNSILCTAEYSFLCRLFDNHAMTVACERCVNQPNEWLVNHGWIRSCIYNCYTYTFTSLLFFLVVVFVRIFFFILFSFHSF